MRTKPTKRERFAPHAARIAEKMYSGYGQKAESPMWLVRHFLAGHRYRLHSNIDCDRDQGTWIDQDTWGTREWDPREQRWVQPGRGWTPRKHRWLQDERDARRAKDDPAFRQTWNRRNLKTLRAWHAKHPGLEAFWAKDEIERLVQLRRIAGLPYVEFVPAVYRIPISIQTAQDLGVKLCKRGKDWDVTATTKQHAYFEHKDGYHTGPITKRGTYERAVNTTHVPSVATVLDPLTIDCLIGNVRKQVTVSAPISWQVDDLGLHVKCGRFDYHPDAAELLRDDCEFYLASKLIDKAWESRRPVDSQGVEIPIDEVFVCFTDSVKAGNCPAGTKTWALEHKLDPRRHVRADVLLRLGTRDSRVQRTVVTAANRCMKEIKRGYSILAEH